jgi:excisionase family DNA binding protein
MSDEYLSVTEAAKKLGVSPRTVQRYCKERRLNFSWVTGKRHKELRILPPITVSQLPGGRRKNIAGSFDYVTKSVFDDVISELKHRLEEKDRKIAVMEEELSELKAMISANRTIPEHSAKEEILSKLETYLYDFEKIRPAEKKLILKIANEVKSHSESLKSLIVIDDTADKI